MEEDDLWRVKNVEHVGVVEKEGHFILFLIPNLKTFFCKVCVSPNGIEPGAYSEIRLDRGGGGGG